jgi:hypothetical protein
MNRYFSNEGNKYTIREKVFKIISHQGKANQNHNEVSFHNSRMGMIIKKRQIITSVGKTIAKLNIILYWWEYKIMKCYGNSLEAPKKK